MSIGRHTVLYTVDGRSSRPVGFMIVLKTFKIPFIKEEIYEIELSWNWRFNLRFYHTFYDQQINAIQIGFICISWFGWPYLD